MNLSKTVARHFELNWLVGKLNRITLPEIVYIDRLDIGGYCYRPIKGELCIEGKFYDLSNGLIAVSINKSNQAATLAHEWRHLWQHYVGIKKEVIEWTLNNSYRESIVSYFTNSRTEMDALKYEIKMAPDECNLEWAEWITHAKTT